MRAGGMEPNGKRVFLMGAGGAGSAIADALAAAGAGSITLFDLDRAKAQALVARIREAHPATAADFGTPTVDGQDVLINATPVGMWPEDGLPAEFASFPRELFVVDIVPRTEQTAFLIKARAAGCRTMTGRQMVAGQVEEILRFFASGSAAAWISQATWSSGSGRSP
jgi:shikimate dehydrogenase